jgi:hypothetical protein
MPFSNIIYIRHVKTYCQINDFPVSQPKILTGRQGMDYPDFLLISPLPLNNHLNCKNKKVMESRKKENHEKDTNDGDGT